MMPCAHNESAWYPYLLCAVNTMMMQCALNESGTHMYCVQYMNLVLCDDAMYNKDIFSCQMMHCVQSAKCDYGCAKVTIVYPGARAFSDSSLRAALNNNLLNIEHECIVHF